MIEESKEKVLVSRKPMKDKSPPIIVSNIETAVATSLSIDGVSI